MLSSNRYFVNLKDSYTILPDIDIRDMFQSVAVPVVPNFLYLSSKVDIENYELHNKRYVFYSNRVPKYKGVYGVLQYLYSDDNVAASLARRPIFD